MFFGFEIIVNDLQIFTNCIQNWNRQFCWILFANMPKDKIPQWGEEHNEPNPCWSKTFISNCSRLGPAIGPSAHGWFVSRLVGAEKTTPSWPVTREATWWLDHFPYLSPLCMWDVNTIGGFCSFMIYFSLVWKQVIQRSNVVFLFRPRLKSSIKFLSFRELCDVVVPNWQL